MKLTFGFSPCPNDCFMFDAIVNQRIDLEDLEFSIQLADVEALNRAAFAGSTYVTKLSYHAYAYCTDDYSLLNSGSVLGRNCGPLLVSKRTISTEEIAAGNIEIAIPGTFTTANLLLSIAFPQARRKRGLLFSEIERALLADRFEAGLIIHESRFTYGAKGLKKIVDFGEIWDQTTRFPLPLGGVAIKRSLPDVMKRKVNRVLRRSVEYALAHRAASRDFVRANAQEICEDVVSRHIDLYVTRYSVDLGEEGRRAVELLFEGGKAIGAIPTSKATIFVNY